MAKQTRNPFSPGAGHPPPYLAGREPEEREFEKLLGQEKILRNVILSGLRGVGKTVLLDRFREIAGEKKWLWTQRNMSESVSIHEEAIAERIITDLSGLTSTMLSYTQKQKAFGFIKEDRSTTHPIGYEVLKDIYRRTPGLVADKLEAVLIKVWELIAPHDPVGIIFAYDEAETLADHREKEQFPLSLMLNVFQGIQAKGLPYMLVLTGLPTLFPKLVDARTYTERMFHLLFLKPLDEEGSRDAITVPMKENVIRFHERTVSTIVDMSAGYPYFIQFIGHEVFDCWKNYPDGAGEPEVPREDIERKLDQDFFSGRWAKATDRQRELMEIIARLNRPQSEFSIQDITDLSRKILDKPFSASHANQMLADLDRAGLVFKDRRGKYLFAVPLMDRFIRRQLGSA